MSEIIAGNTGWIRLSRSLPEHWVYEEDRFDHTHAWIDLLMLANYTDKKTIYRNELIICKRGDVNYSLKFLAKRWGWSWKAVKHFIDVLESDGMVITDITTSRTVITLVNYDKYQIKNPEGMNEGMNEGHNELPNEGINEGNSEGINEGNNEGHNEGINEGHITNKRNERKERKERKSIYGEYRHVSLTDTERDKLFKDYGEEKTLEAIKFLDEYKERKGYTSKNDNLTLRKWVFDAVKRDKEQAGQSSPASTNPKAHNFEERNYDYAALESELFGNGGGQTDG